MNRTLVWNEYELLDAAVVELAAQYLNAPDKDAWVREVGLDHYWKDAEWHAEEGDWPDEIGWDELSNFAIEHWLDTEWEWECFMDALQEALDGFDTDYWHVEGYNMGWLKRDGYKTVDGTKAINFIRAITPDRGEWDATLTISDTEIRAVVSEHDGTASFVAVPLETHLTHVARNLAQAKGITEAQAKAWVDYYTYDSTITLEQALECFDPEEAAELEAAT